VLFERTSVGLDVHARSVAAAAIDGVTGELKWARLTPSHEHIRSWIGGLDGPVAVAYEAGPTGFGLYRALTAAGIRCVVAAPSKIQRPSGDRVKTDARDAVYLARLLRIGELTPVAVPSVAQEAARDLVRAREDCRGDLMRARHRLSKLLLRHGIVYSGGNAWTGPHDRWLRQQRFTDPATMAAFESDYDTVLTVTGPPGPAGHGNHRDGRRLRVHPGCAPTRLPTRRRNADRVRPRGGDRRLAPVHRQQHRLVRRPGAHRELLRHHPGAGFDHQNRQHPRPTAAVEAAWHHQTRYLPGKTMRDRWELARPAARARGDAGNRRLHARWVDFHLRRKKTVTANVAIARELAGWCWSLAVLE
jgi:hypothetical protein